jgi:protein TonB
MFEDSTFESTGRIRTGSRGWMIAAFIFNASILLALILIPLIYPEALPRQAIAFLMETPPPPPAAQPPQRQQPVREVHGGTEMPGGQLLAPRKIPIDIFIASGPEPPLMQGIPGGDPDSGVPGGTDKIFRGQSTPTVVRPEVKAPVRVSSSVEAGLLIQKRLPVYPPLALAMHLEGTVVLAASISKTGTIENLHVVSGPPMLQQAALDAVKTWRYKPYMLDGQPVDVETTVNVVFILGR